MKKCLAIIAVIAAFIITGCSSAPKKSVLDAQWQGKGKSYGAKNFVKPKSWAPGQYVVTGSLDDGEKKSVTKSLIVGKSGGGWIFETITTDDDNKTTGMQMLIKGYEKAAAKKDASYIEVVWMKMLKDDGTVQKLDGEALMIYNVMLKSTWSNIIVSGTKFSNGGAVKVPAGTFAGTTKAKSTVKILFKTIEGVSYMHPDVPVNGVVKSVSGDSVTELIDFGFNGKATIK